MRKSLHIVSLLVAAALLGGVSMPTGAVDGVILIDQNKALAGNVTPGDTPGFPVTISLPGSYRLASNLRVSDANTDAIEITASHVTLDLNGFAILGPTDCITGGLDPCANNGFGSGVHTPTQQFNITIRNGTIQGMGNAGVFLLGDSHLVENMHVRSNGFGGIAIVSSSDPGSIVQNNTVQRNGGDGITMDKGLVSHNVVDVNMIGILIAVGSVTYNVVTRNVSFGLFLDGAGNYIGNMVNGNGVKNVDNNGGWVNQGQNLCGTATCPGAQF